MNDNNSKQLYIDFEAYERMAEPHKPKSVIRKSFLSFSNDRH